MIRLGTSFFAVVVLCALATVTADQANGLGIFPTGGLTTSCSLSQPAVAMANGMNKNTLCEDFLSASTIDSGETWDAGYNWYIKVAFGNSTSGAFMGPSDFTVGSSILNLNTQDTAGGFSLFSATTTGYTPTVTTVGKTFTPPFYMEFKIAVNQSLAPGSLGNGDCGSGVVSRYSWPTIWLNDMNLTIAQWGVGAAPISSNKAEVDILEFYVGCSGMGPGTWDPLSNIHIWSSATTIATSDTNMVSWGAGSWDGVTYHTLGELITSTSAKTYFDGTLEQTIDLTMGGLGPAATGDYNIMMNPGVAWPLHVDYVQVWQ